MLNKITPETETIINTIVRLGGQYTDDRHLNNLDGLTQASVFAIVNLMADDGEVTEQFVSPLPEKHPSPFWDFISTLHPLYIRGSAVHLSKLARHSLVSKQSTLVEAVSEFNALWSSSQRCRAKIIATITVF